MTYLDRIVAHPALRGRTASELGCTLPDPKGLVEFDETPDSRAALAARGIRVRGPVHDNRFLIHADCEYSEIRVHSHAPGNVVVIGKSQSLSAEITLDVSNNTVIFGEKSSRSARKIHLNIRRNGSLFLMGREQSINDSNILIEGPERLVAVGDECLFSWDVHLRTTDSHAIFEMSDRPEQINPPRDVIISPFVWLGEGVIVNKGNVVGVGSVVGQRSVVTKSIPAFCVAVGVPARIVRRNTTWTPHSRPTAEQMRHAIELRKAHMPG